MSADQDEAKVFLQNFLAQLARSEQTNRELVRVQLGLFQQNNQIIQALSTLSSQLDGIAQRTDYLYDQMGHLGRILVNDTSAPPGEIAPPYVNDYAQDLGRRAVDGIVNSFFPGRSGRGGGGRPRRR